MDDPILPSEPAAPVAPVAPVGSEQMDRLEAVMQQLTATMADAATRMAAPPPMAQMPAEDFLNEMAANPQGVIQREARLAFQQAANEGLNPAVLQVLETGSQQLMAMREAEIDARFGEGTFAEVYRPQLEKDMAQLRQVNPKATADPLTVTALVDRVSGANVEALMERRRNLEGTARNRGLSHTLPSGGIPRLRASRDLSQEIPDDVEVFLQDVEKATGEQVDRKGFTKLYHTGVESGPGRHRTSVLDYLKARGADAATLKAYGGDRSGT